ncbi:MAG: lytic transglycosylase domain-containing protein [Alphaproteobacteria bacterium]|nr:lytic transglycosylase domain-containing protein [Alphaproteobacteria bacterium]
MTRATRARGGGLCWSRPDAQRDKAAWRMKGRLARLGLGAVLVAGLFASVTACLAVPSVAPPPVPRSAPVLPQTGSGNLEDAGRQAFKEALDAASQGRWRQAALSAERVGHPIAAALIEWQRLRNPEAAATFAEIVAFLKIYSGWPGRVALLRRAEELMPEAWPNQEARAWFARFPPVSGPGKQRFAEAMIADGAAEVGARMLRDAWVAGDFPAGLEQHFLERHGAILNVEDHNRRLDRLLWDERRGQARRQLRRVGKAERRLGEARLRLMERRQGVDWALRQVPSALQAHPGLQFERIRWRRRAGRHEGARDLLLNRPVELGRPGKWWREQNYQIREAIRHRLFADAYAIASRHGQKEAGPFSEAEWLAGWLALRFLDRPDAAAEHFRAMYDRVRYPISRARAAYWSGRAAAAIGDRDAAAEWFRRAARHPATFYGQLAGTAVSVERRFPAAVPSVLPEEQERFQARPLVQAARLLGETGDFETMATIVTHLSRRASTPAEHLLVSRLGLAYGAPHISIDAAKRAWRNGTPLIAEAYPLAFDAEDTASVSGSPELALLLGLARQESEMNPQAVSRSGAMGLMQLMPATARQVSRSLGMAYSRSRLREDRRYNIMLGSIYLAGLLETFRGDRALAVAAYNAGPNRVRAWLRTYGDPRGGRVDPIDWIELVPFAETRNYIQRVLESAVVYRHRLNTPTDSAAVPSVAGTTVAD